MSGRNLSKSKILSGVQCRKRLWLEVNQPDLVEYGADAEKRFLQGRQVGEVARSLFPEGKLIGDHENLSNSIKDTRAHVENNSQCPLFEATFVSNGVLIMADIFLNEDDGYRLVEVKGATSVKDYYLIDAAVQAWVIEAAGIRLKKVQIAHVDNTFVYRTIGDYRGLLKFEDVTDAISGHKKKIPILIDDFKSVLKNEIPEIKMGSQCYEPYSCPFIEHCTPEDSPEYPVEILPNGGKVIEGLLADGIKDVRDIPPGRLTKDKHKRVWRVTVTGQAELDPEVQAVMRKFGYPRYYLDFETIDYSVPVWIGTRTFQPLPIQYSLHIERKQGQLEHREYLDTTGDSPMRDLVERLLIDLGETGPIFAYSPFEKRVLNTLVELFPDLKSKINRLIDRLVDLLPIARDNYYHPAQMGSWSMKAVLPTIAPELSYEDLDEVQHGTGAQMAYLELIAPHTTEDRKKELKEKMLKYCKMDTMGLVKLAHFFSTGFQQ